MKIWKIDTAPDLQRLIDEARHAGVLRIADDEGELKVKGDESMWSIGLGTIEVDRADEVPAAERLYEKCDHCHLFVERNEDAEYLGCEHSGTTLHEFGPVIVPTTVGVLPHQTCKFCRTVRPTLYMHSHRGNAVDTLLDESHEAAPSGRKANLLTWQTYGPLAMRERFTA